MKLNQIRDNNEKIALNKSLRFLVKTTSDVVILLDIGSMNTKIVNTLNALPAFINFTFILVDSGKCSILLVEYSCWFGFQFPLPYLADNSNINICFYGCIAVMLRGIRYLVFRYITLNNLDCS